MYTSNQKASPFLEKISQFNFDKFYTKKNRIICHVGMWLFFSILLFSNYSLELKIPFKSSFFLTLRGTINNMTVFYLFFYIVVPRIFKSSFWGVFFIILCIPLSIYVWMSINYLQLSLLHHLGIEISQGPLKGIIGKSAMLTYWQTISYKSVFGNSMLVIYSFSPPFFVKILFDITRLFNRTIYFQKQSLVLELQKLNVEKDFLKAQLNPHFLFNTLNNLYGLVVKKDPSATDVIINISDLMAYTLYESNTEKVPLEKELDFIQNYFYLERMRYAAHKDISLDISTQDALDHLEIAPLLSFTFIENAFKYGLKSDGENFLKISISIVNNIFYFAIENNREKNLVKKKSFGGIGIKNTEKRLRLIYPDNHKLITEERESSFYVSLSINLAP
jgi:two-component system LytT family sensor kinase